MSPESGLYDEKIAFLGLSNAGKTSIIKVLRQEFDILAKLKPTQGVDRTSLYFFGKSLILWDFGGQDRYREVYLNKPAEYLALITNVFYIIDVQDLETVDLSTDYFKALFEDLQQFSPNAKYTVLLHKYDPGLNDQTDIPTRFFESITPLLKKYNTSVFVYKTSIHDVMSIISAFSQSVLDKEHLYSNLSRNLELFSKIYNIDFAILYTRNFLELGRYSSIKMRPEKLDAIFQRYYIKLDVNQAKPPFIELTYENLKILNFKFQIKYDKIEMPFSLVIGFPASESATIDTLRKEAFEKLKNDLNKLFMSTNLPGFLLKM